MWIGGEWVWNGGWFWVGGHWGYPPHPHAIWIGGRSWDDEHGWHNFHGHWRGFFSPPVFPLPRQTKTLRRIASQCLETVQCLNKSRQEVTGRHGVGQIAGRRGAHGVAGIVAARRAGRNVGAGVELDIGRQIVRIVDGVVALLVLFQRELVSD